MSNPVRQPRKREPLVPAALLVGLVLAVILILGISFLGWTNKQGFLGTYAPVIADVNLIAQIALLGLLIAGLVEIKRKKNTRAPLPAHNGGPLQRGAHCFYYDREIFPPFFAGFFRLAVDHPRHSGFGCDRPWCLPHAADG